MMLNLIKNFKLEFKKPKKNKILIYDCNSIESLKKTIQQNYSLLFTRGEVINIPCLIIALKFLFNQKKIRISYIEEYIKQVNPKIIITNIDNNLEFYNLVLSEEIKTIVIQNGKRTKEFIESIKNPDKISASYMLMHGKSISNYYKKKFSKTNFVVTGSIINNSIKKKSYSPRKIKKLLFISQYEKNIYEENSKFYSIDKRVINLLSRWCSENKFQLHIAGRTNNKAEENFFSKIISYKSFHYHQNKYPEFSYKLVDNSDLIVTIDSTLGDEALARGKKIAFFSARDEFIGSNDRAFGWPKKNPIFGFFWGSKFNYAEYIKILNNINNINQERWLEKIEYYKSEIMVYDSLNKKLTNLITKLLLS